MTLEDLIKKYEGELAKNRREPKSSEPAAWAKVWCEKILDDLRELSGDSS